jgi:phosphoribosylaminoimidazole (AIR) synthetase
MGQWPIVIENRSKVAHVNPASALRTFNMMIGLVAIIYLAE